jgi:hypothetical protein
VTPERVEEICAALAGLVVPLDPDPAARGPKYLQDLISRTRGYLNEVSTYLSEVLRERHRLEMQLDALEGAFAISADELLANDRRVSLLPSIQDRQSMINVLLSKERKEIQNCKREIKTLGHVERAVRHRHKELESTMSAIRLQRSLVESELRTGAYYGDETDESRGTWGRRPGAPPAGAMDDMDEDELARLVNAESALVDQATPAAEPEVPGVKAEPPAPTPVAPAPTPVAAAPKPAPAVEKDPIDDLLGLSDEDLEAADVKSTKPKEPPPKPVTDPDKQIADFLNEDSEETGDIFSGL